MEKAQIDALLVAHGGRAQPVASFHLLRAPSFGDAEHAFLTSHAASLATIDLSRWLGHATPEQRPAVLDALVALAEREPGRFEFEIARAPHFPIADAERTELIIRLVGRAPEAVIAALSPEAGLAPSQAVARHPAEVARHPAEVASHPAEIVPAAAGAAASEGFFDPGDILAELDFDAGFLGGEGQSAGAATVPAAGGAAVPGAAGGAAAGGGATGSRAASGDPAGSTPDWSGPPGEGLGDLLGDADILGLGDAFGDTDPLGNAGSGAHSTSPEIDSLLTDLAAAKGPRATSGNRSRALTAWKKRALAAAESGAEDWGPSVTRLPPEMKGAILVRASASPRGEERAALLEWLQKNGEKRKRLVDLTVSLLGISGEAAGVRAWLAESWIPRLLPDKAAWSRHGAAVLSTMVDKRAFSELDELFAAVANGAAALGPGLVSMPGAAGATPPPPSTLSAAFTTTLVAATKAALEAARRKEALASAAALACLGIPSRDRPALAALRRKKAAKGEVATLLALAESRARRPKEAPRLEDLVATVHVLSDATS